MRLEKAYMVCLKVRLFPVPDLLHWNLQKKKIRFNCVSPGVVTTPMSKEAVYSKDEESFNRIKSYHPLGLGHPEDVANACMFLLSDAAKWITGSNLVVDGGYTAR